MSHVRDYQQLEILEHREGQQVMVDATRFVYAWKDGRWLFVGRHTG